MSLLGGHVQAGPTPPHWRPEAASGHSCLGHARAHTSGLTVPSSLPHQCQALPGLCQPAVPAHLGGQTQQRPGGHWSSRRQDAGILGPGTRGIK